MNWGSGSIWGKLKTEMRKPRCERVVTLEINRYHSGIESTYKFKNSIHGLGNRMAIQNNTLFIQKKKNEKFITYKNVIWRDKPYE